MDTHNRPAWAVKGAIVNVNGKHWTGQIIDVAVSDSGLVLLLIDSPKADFFGTPPEWLVYDPNQITLGTPHDMLACTMRYRHMLAAKESFITRWFDEAEPKKDIGYEWPDEKV